MFSILLPYSLFNALVIWLTFDLAEQLISICHEKIYDLVLDGIIYNVYPIQIQGKNLCGGTVSWVFPRLHSNPRLFQRNV